MERNPNILLPETQKPNFKKLALLIGGAIILPPILWVCFVLFVCQPVKVEGTTMFPAIKHGDKIFILKQISRLKRGDIVIFHFPRDTTKSFIKRIVGLPGETIRIDELGKTHINGSPIDEPYISPYCYRSPRKIEEMEIPSDQYFVMGDNRDSSNDSRHWGTVSRNLIYGKYWWTYWKAEKQ
jgi:signal peptidase I